MGYSFPSIDESQVSRMTELTIDAFEAFFAELNGGNDPYPWQSQVVRDIAAGDWPDQIVAPTGTGKSALIEMLVFLRALSVAEGRTFPRRYVFAVGRRALVDSQADHGIEIVRRLAASEGGVLALAHSHLARAGLEPLRATIMRGGAALDNAWLDDPLGCQLVFATPDLLGSRLLFRGYLASALSRPRHAGLLAYDTVAVVDESHLNRQLVRTLRRVGELAARSPLCDVLPPLHVIETTATPVSETSRRVLVNSSGGDVRLERRLRAHKALEIRTLREWPAPRTGNSRADFCDQVADAAQQLRGEADGTIGVVLNRVRDAVDVAAVLTGRGLRVRVLVGRMRAFDREELARRTPGLLTPDGNQEVDVLVATQAVEVGLDLDFHGLVTEIGSGAALVQRFGRVNRRGRRGRAPIVIFGPEDAETVREASPYESDDIVASMMWLQGICDSGGDLSPQVLSEAPPPHETLRRLMLSRLEPSEAALLSRTSEDLFAEPDLDLWLRDDLNPARPEVSIIGRHLPTEPSVTRELLMVTPPQPHELYPAQIGEARRILTSSEAPPAAFLWRAGQLLDVEGAAAAAARMLPGDILVLDAGVRAAFGGVFVGIDLPAKGSVALARGPIGDVLAAPQASGGTTLPPRYTVILGDATTAASSRAEVGNDATRLLAALPAAMRLAEDQQDIEGALTAANVADALPTDLAKDWMALFAGAGEPTATVSTWVLPAAPDAEDTFPWLVVAQDPLSRLPSDLIQEQSPSGTVTLSHHQRDVGDRVEQLARALRLPDGLKAALGAAGRHHDDGKVAAEWQLGVGSRSTEPLAKSPKRARSSRRRPRSTGLPLGWRHEQLSVALAWDELPYEIRPLAARLIGTSHGHGRTAFPHGSADLVREDQAHVRWQARELFDLGGWDVLIDQTDHSWGVWGVAYLEALLRAADVQVSKEGH